MRVSLLLAVAATAAFTAEADTGPVSRVVLFDEIVKVPRSQWRALTVTLKQRPATIEVDQTVVNGDASVRAVLMSRQDVERFRDGKSHRILAAAETGRSGRIRHLVTRPGDYVLLLDNRSEGRPEKRGEGRGGSAVQLNVTLSFDPRYASFEPGQLPPERRQLVVAVSLLGFAVIGGWSGWRLWNATLRRRRTIGPPPPSF